MTWNSTAPLGSVSVKANRTILQDNTTYTEVTMGNSVVGTNAVTTRDHFWNVGADEDGRHRFINSPAFTDTLGAAADPVIGSGMDGVGYLKTVLGTVQQFYQNAQGIYQTSPAVLRGTVAINIANTFVTIVPVPANCYGEIFMYTAAAQGSFSTVTGFFRSAGAIVESWTLGNFPVGTDVATGGLLFLNGAGAVDLNIKARRAGAGAATWTYIITYRAL